MNFYLPERQIKALRQIASKTELSMAEIIRRAIDFYLNEKGDLWQRKHGSAKLAENIVREIKE